ncbi:MAG: response regulator [Burkholderiaceae bacterium]
MRSISSVLLIEDNPGDARLVTEYLAESFGGACRVISAATLDAGLMALRKTRVDVVLLDLALPDSQGLETLSQFQASAPRVPIVILTGDDNDDLAIEALRGGAQDYLPKKQASSAALTRAMCYAVARHLAADELHDARVGDAMAAEGVEDGIVQVDSSASIRYANTRVASLLGIVRAELEGRSLLGLVDPAHREALAGLLATPPGVRSSCELRLLRPDSALCWVVASAGGILALPGDGFELVVMLTDITARKLAD